MPRGEHHAMKLECVNGHAFTPENVLVSRSAGGTLTRVCRACHRNHTNAATLRGDHPSKLWRRKNGTKLSYRRQKAASDAIVYATRTGKLIRPDKCERCGEAHKVQAHHFMGYAKRNRLKVRWLCSLCHSVEERGL